MVVALRGLHQLSVCLWEVVSGKVCRGYRWCHKRLTSGRRHLDLGHLWAVVSGHLHRHYTVQIITHVGRVSVLVLTLTVSVTLGVRRIRWILH